jgi:K+-transporting ATPase ATPase B chain
MLDDPQIPSRTEVTTSTRPPRSIPERDADPARGLTPPSTRTPETDEGKELTATRKAGGGSMFQGPLVRAAVRESFRKLDPRAVARNPVMFVVEIGAAITTIVLIQLIATRTGNIGFTLQITLWLWFTVVFANFAEAMAEARGKAQADTLRATKRETPARRIRDGREETISSAELRKGDVILVREGEIIASDGEVIEGVAYVNEAAITGESAPVL